MLGTEIIAKKINNDINILIDKSYNYNEDILKKLNNIVAFNKNIHININEGLLKIVVV